MKFLVFMAVVAGVAAQTTVSKAPTPSVVVQIPPGGDKDCLANYIVKQCLQSESDKLAACPITDYQCICYANQAIATCYNNCPNDTRAPSATQSMNAACALAAQYAPATTKKPTTTTISSSSAVSAPATTSTSLPSEAPSPTEAPTSVGFSTGDGVSKTSGAGARAVNAAGWLAAVAGMLAVAL